MTWWHLVCFLLVAKLVSSHKQNERTNGAPSPNHLEIIYWWTRYKKKSLIVVKWRHIYEKKENFGSENRNIIRPFVCPSSPPGWSGGFWLSFIQKKLLLSFALCVVCCGLVFSSLLQPLVELEGLSRCVFLCEWSPIHPSDCYWLLLIANTIKVKKEEEKMMASKWESERIRLRTHSNILV